MTIENVWSWYQIVPTLSKETSSIHPSIVSAVYGQFHSKLLRCKLCICSAFHLSCLLCRKSSFHVWTFVTTSSLRGKNQKTSYIPLVVLILGKFCYYDIQWCHFSSEIDCKCVQQSSFSTHCSRIHAIDQALQPQVT